MLEDNDDISEIKQTWNKIESVSRKTGLREGISDGRDRCFQEYFDMGFKEGFKNGYALAKYKGLLAAHSRQNKSEIVEYSLLEKTSRSGCEICKNEELLDDDVQDIIRKQTEASNSNLNELYSTFHKTFSCKVPESLNNVPS